MKKKLIIKKLKPGTGSISAKIAEKQRRDRERKAEEERKAKEAAQKEKSSHKNISSGTEKNIPAQTTEQPPKVKFASRRSFNKHASKGKGNLREEILRKEEHKKFFIKQKTHQDPDKTDQSYYQRSSIPKEIKITEFIQVGSLAKKLNIKTSDIISKLMQMGEMVTITQSIDSDTAFLVAEEFGCKVNVVSLYDETIISEEETSKENLQSRPPVVTVMGHVDHGKTMLLDRIRKTDMITQEAGGITQHIGAYSVQTPGGSITFLDTPGHEAFTAMRARGAQLTDIVVLVVAANDGVMPQTLEAHQHAKDAGVPIIVAINKVDLSEANSEKIKQELSQNGLTPEEWGGETPYAEISALKGTNIDALNEIILAQSELLELKADTNKRAIGITVEARLDQGRGPVATILIQNGTLKMGDCFVVGMEGGRVKAMFDSRGAKLKAAGPSTPVEILGFFGVPQAGDPFHVMESDKHMKSIVEKRQELNRQQQSQKIKKVKSENLDDAIQEGRIEQFKIILKGDVRGSVEAIQTSLEKLSTEEIAVNVVLKSTGEITESDVMLASAANAVIVAFNVRANAKVRLASEKEGVNIYYFKIIYEVVDKIKEAMEGLLSPDVQEKHLGELEIRELFKISSIGTIGGSMVTSGLIKRDGKVRIIRDGVVIHEGNIKTLKRFKDDTSEVKEGFECGILIDDYNDIKVGDRIECYENQHIARTL